jgi:hypothetical protein
MDIGSIVVSILSYFLLAGLAVLAYHVYMNNRKNPLPSAPAPSSSRVENPNEVASTAPESFPASFPAASVDSIRARRAPIDVAAEVQKLAAGIRAGPATVPFYRALGEKLCFNLSNSGFHDVQSGITTELPTLQLFHNENACGPIDVNDPKDFTFLSIEEWQKFTKGYDLIVTVAAVGAQGIGKSTSLDVIFFADEQNVRDGQGRVKLHCMPFHTSHTSRDTKGLQAVLVDMPEECLPPRFRRANLTQTALAHLRSVNYVGDVVQNFVEHTTQRVGLLIIDVEGLFTSAAGEDARGAALLMRVWTISNVLIHMFDTANSNDFNFISATLNILHTSPILSEIYREAFPNSYKPHLIGFNFSAKRIQEMMSFHHYSKWFPGGRVPEEVNGPQFCLSPYHKAHDNFTEEYYQPTDPEVTLTLNPYDVRRCLQDYLRIQTEAAARTPTQLYAVMSKWNAPTYRKLERVQRFGFQPCAAKCRVCNLPCLHSALAPHDHGNIDTCTDIRARRILVCSRHRTQEATVLPFYARGLFIGSFYRYRCNLCEDERGSRDASAGIPLRRAHFWPNKEVELHFIDIGVHNFSKP